MDREASRAVVHRVINSQTRPSDEHRQCVQPSACQGGSTDSLTPLTAFVSGPVQLSTQLATDPPSLFPSTVLVPPGAGPVT